MLFGHVAAQTVESMMGDQRKEQPQNPGSGSMDEDKKRENDRAGQKPQEKYEKDQASNPERRDRQDPQYNPSHIQEDPNRESTR